MDFLKITKNWCIETLYPNNAKIIDTPHYTSPKFIHGNIPIITTSQCSTVGINYTDLDFTSHKEYEKRRQFIDPDIGDILFTREAPAGIAVLVDRKEIVVGQRIVLLKTNKKKIYNRFLVYFLNSNLNKQQLDFFSIKTTVERINIEEIKKIQIPIPSPSVQEKISNILSNIDELINKLETLIEKKKNIKQGTMQELLTGKRRLEGFSEDWETKELEKIVEIKKGQLITEKTVVAGNIPVIGGGKTSSYSHNKPNRFHKTITISASGANAGYVSFHDYPIFASDCLTIEERENYSIEFIFFQLKRLQNEIYFSQTGGAQPHIHAKDLYPLKIPIPKTKKGQTIISKILLDMDLEINNLEKQRDKYIKLKQGTMQKLLTGEIRLQ